MVDARGFWERVNFLIKTNNTTQSAVSQTLGFNSRRIQNLSGANRLPDIIEGYKIAKELGTTVEYLVTGDNEVPKPDVSKIMFTLEEIKRLIDSL